MATSVKFLKGLASAYAGLATKNVDTFYYTTDDNQLYLGTIRLSNTNEVLAAVSRIAQNESDIVTINATLAKIEGDESVEGSIKKAVADAKSALETKIGNLESLSTTHKTDLVGAINEVLGAVGAGGTAAAVTLETESTSESATAYTLYQGENKIGTINVPKDLVVKSGEVVVNPEGQEPGTYIVLTISDNEGTELFINVGTLVDIYKATENATQVQLSIDSDTREISAAIVAGSITATEIANNAITTDKIADANVTTAKLSIEIQSALTKANTAIQAVAAGSADGTISVDGEDVAVTGLKSAAYTEASAYDPAGSAGTAESNAKGYADGLDAAMGERVGKLEAALDGEGSVASQIATAKQEAINESKSYATSYVGDRIAMLDADIVSETVEAGKGIQVQVVEENGKVTQVVVSGDYSNTYDAKGAATTAESNAKTYVDEALTWGTM